MWPCTAWEESYTDQPLLLSSLGLRLSRQDQGSDEAKDKALDLRL